MNPIHIIYTFAAQVDCHHWPDRSSCFFVCDRVIRLNNHVSFTSAIHSCCNQITFNRWYRDSWIKKYLIWIDSEKKSWFDMIWFFKFPPLIWFFFQCLWFDLMTILVWFDLNLNWNQMICANHCTTLAKILNNYLRSLTLVTTILIRNLLHALYFDCHAIRILGVYCPLLIITWPVHQNIGCLLSLVNHYLASLSEYWVFTVPC